MSDSGSSLSELDEEQRHRLRIDVKKLRYALEFTASLHCVATAGVAFGRALREMQESLGHLNDARTAQGMLAAIGEAGDAVLPRDPVAERRHLAKAGRQFAKLMAAGPYWRQG